MIFKDKMSLCYVGVLFLNLTFAILAERVHVAQWIRTDITGNTNLYSFETLFGQGIQNCIDACKAKKQCKFINFYRQGITTCALIGAYTSGNFTTKDYLESKSGFIFGDKKEWNMAGYEACGECRETGVCNTKTKYSMCLNSGCAPPMKKKNAVILGNMFSVGRRVRYKCVDGYKNNRTDTPVSTCLENGTWSTAHIQCLTVAVFGSNVYEFNNTFYKLVRQEQNWDNAKQTCVDLRGYLVDIKSQEEQEFIENTIIILDNFKCYYTGGRMQSGVITWLDGTPIDDNIYSNFANGESSTSQNEEDCLQLHSDYSYKWNDIRCSEPCFVICELIN